LRWLNFQFPEERFHHFYYSFDLGNEGIYEVGERAAVMNGEWYHFQPEDFQIMEVGHRKDDDVPTKVPIEWKVTARKESSGASLLDLKIKTTTKLS